MFIINSSTSGDEKIFSFCFFFYSLSFSLNLVDNDNKRLGGASEY